MKRLQKQCLLKVFINVKKALAPGGYFIADILNEKEVGNGELIDFEYDETTNAQFSITADENKNVCLKISVFENNELKFEEKIIEKIHDPEMVCNLLRKAGFKDIILDHKLLDSQDSQAITWFIICKN